MKRQGRRELLQALALAFGAAFAPRAAATAARQTGDLGSTVIGYSQGGQPLTVYHLGDGPTRVFLLGGQHGGPEANTIDLADLILAHYVEEPSGLPPKLGLDVMPLGNPDGRLTGSRQHLSGVDPNRNWAAPDWETDAYDSDGQLRAGLGGEEPFSEPEVHALASWLVWQRPELVVNYHSVGGFLLGAEASPTGELAQIYAEASGYPWLESVGSVPYPVTGSMDGWLDDLGIANLFVELATGTEPELDQNLAGLDSTLEYLAQIAGRGETESGARRGRAARLVARRWT